MLTDESDETRKIRKNVILLQIPCINPDGLDIVSHWYQGNVGSPYENAPLPTLYQKYSGHDNNRDWYMLNLVETQNVTRLMFQEWFPQIVYNQHQTAPFPARIFVPPFADPMNPNIPPQVMRGIASVGDVWADMSAAAQSLKAAIAHLKRSSKLSNTEDTEDTEDQSVEDSSAESTPRKTRKRSSSASSSRRKAGPRGRDLT